MTSCIHIYIYIYIHNTSCMYVNANMGRLWPVFGPPLAVGIIQGREHKHVGETRHVVETRNVWHCGHGCANMLATRHDGYRKCRALRTTIIKYIHKYMSSYQHIYIYIHKYIHIYIYIHTTHYACM